MKILEKIDGVSFSLLRERMTERLKPTTYVEPEVHNTWPKSWQQPRPARVLLSPATPEQLTLADVVEDGITCVEHHDAREAIVQCLVMVRCPECSRRHFWPRGDYLTRRPMFVTCRCGDVHRLPELGL